MRTSPVTEIIHILVNGGITLPIYKISAPLTLEIPNIVVNSIPMKGNEDLCQNLVNVNVRSFKVNGMPDTAFFDTTYTAIQNLFGAHGRIDTTGGRYLYAIIQTDPAYFDDQDGKFYVMNIRISVTTSNT